MKPETRTIKIYEATHQPLRMAAAMTGESMMILLHRLVTQELGRLEKLKRQEATTKTGEI